MASSRDILFGQIALERGMITKPALDAALAKQEKGDRRQLGMLLLESGQLDEEELQMVLEIQRERLSKTAEHSASQLADVLFGRLVVGRKLATQAQVNECLREQARTDQMGLFMKLGEMLVRKGYLTQEAADEVIAYQKQKLKEFGVPE